MKRTPARITTRAMAWWWGLCLSWAALQGCAGTRPWEREDLARRGMQVEPDPQTAALDQHVYEYREGASGGYSAHSGSGCGCN